VRKDRRQDRSKVPCPHIGFIASVSIIGLACKPRSAFQLCEIKGVRFPANAWSIAAATLQKACLEMKGVPRRQATRNNPSWRRTRLTSNVKGASRLLMSRQPNGEKPGYPIRQAGTALRP